MSPIAEPPPAVWRAPVGPPQITRTFRPGAPYAAGGHRGIDLRAQSGDTVRAPCRGVVTFRGAVAGGPPTLTIRCGELRATLQRVRPSVGRGAAVGVGDAVGVATGSAVDLSARRADDTYVDPARLLRLAEPRVPPAIVARRPTSPTRRAQHPARIADRALVTPQTMRPMEAADGSQRRAVDRPLGVAGTVMAGTALVALAAAGLRRRRLGPWRAARALRPRVQR